MSSKNKKSKKIQDRIDAIVSAAPVAYSKWKNQSSRSDEGSHDHGDLPADENSEIKPEATKPHDQISDGSSASGDEETTFTHSPSDSDTSWKEPNLQNHLNAPTVINSEPDPELEAAKKAHESNARPVIPPVNPESLPQPEPYINSEPTQEIAPDVTTPNPNETLVEDSVDNSNDVGSANSPNVISVSDAQELFASHEVFSKLSDVAATMSARIRKDELMQSLQLDLKQHQSDLVLKILRPFINEIIVTHQNLSRMRDNFEKKSIDEVPISEVFNLIDGVADDLELTLSENGIDLFDEDNVCEKFNAKTQKIVGHIRTDDKEKIGYVAEIVRAGFATDNKVIQKQRVRVFKFVKAEQQPKS